MKQRRIAFVFAVIFLVGILAGCSSQPTTTATTTAAATAAVTTAAPTTAAAGGTAATTAATVTEAANTPASKFTTDKIELKQWTLLNPEDKTGRGLALQMLIDQYQTEYPNAKIITEPQIWTDLQAKQSAAHFAGNAPDIMWNNADNLAGMIAIGAYEPFENLFMDEWTPEQHAFIEDPIWGSGTSDGKHYFVDISRPPMVFMYREDLFKKYNIPTVFESWEDFAVEMQKFNGVVEDGVEMYGFGVVYSSKSASNTPLTAALFTQPGGPVHEDGRANFVTPEGIKMLELQKKFIDEYKITPEYALSTDVEDVYNAFSAGQYAAILGTPPRTPGTRANAVYDPLYLQIMSPPKTDGQWSKFAAAGWGLGVWSGSKYKYEAGKFVELFTGAEADWLFTEVGGQVGLRDQTYVDHPEFFEKPESTYIMDIKKTLDNQMVPLPATPIVGMREVLCEAMQDFYLGGMTAEQALQNAEKKFNELNVR